MVSDGAALQTNETFASYLEKRLFDNSELAAFFAARGLTLNVGAPKGCMIQ